MLFTVPDQALPALGISQLKRKASGTGAVEHLLQVGLRASGHQGCYAALLRCPAYACAQAAQAHQGCPTQQHLQWAGLNRNMQKTPAQAALGSVRCNDLFHASSCCFRPS